MGLFSPGSHTWQRGQETQEAELDSRAVRVQLAPSLGMNSSLVSANVCVRTFPGINKEYLLPACCNTHMLPAVRKYESSSGGQGRAFGLLQCSPGSQNDGRNPSQDSQEPLTAARLCRLHNLLFYFAGRVGGQMAKFSCKSRDKAAKVQGVRPHGHEYSVF